MRTLSDKQMRVRSDARCTSVGFSELLISEEPFYSGRDTGEGPILWEEFERG